MALCAKCGKESNNLRVCPFCHTPYFADDVAARKSTAIPRPSTTTPRPSTAVPRPSTAMPAPGAAPRPSSTTTPRMTGAVPRQTTSGIPRVTTSVPVQAVGPKPIVSKPTIVGLSLLVVAVGAWYWFFLREPPLPTGVVLPNQIIGTMSAGEAEATVRQVNRSAKIETKGTELAVTFPSETWPQRQAGQLALAQQYTRALEVVEGKPRTIQYYTPEKKLFAKAEASGVILVR